MKLTRALIGLAGATVLTASLAANPTFAATSSDTYPETPALNPTLPIIHTSHGSDHLKANVLNPRPVCNALEDHRTVVYKVTDHFLPVGTISTRNETKGTIPLTQETSRTQEIGLEVNGSRTEKLDVNVGGNASGKNGGGQAGIAYSLASMVGAQASYSLSWTAGQQVGPYDVPAGHTGEATYGFRAITMSGTQQFCTSNGTWSTPTAWTSFAPIKNEVRVRLYDNASGAFGGTPSDPAQTPTQPEVKEEVGTLPEQPAVTEPAGQQAHDLEPHFTVAAGKAEGYAGLVALRVKNVGTDRYYADFPAVSFKVEVKTEDGPEGVDRLITPGYFNGAYTQDLGFDPKTSTRTFIVTLANPIKAGEDQLVANFNFGDGNTSEGRLVNSISVSQIGRLDDDKSTANDQNISSLDATTTDGGKQNKGRF